MHMKIILFFSFFSIISYKSYAQNEAFKAETFTDETGNTLQYRILYPPNYNEKIKYPLLVFLHGSGERGSDNAAQLTHGAKTLVDFVQTEPAIIIVPQCPVDDYWANVSFANQKKLPYDINYNYDQKETKALHSVIALTKNFIKTKRVDKHLIYISGLSMGGMGTCEAVYRYPKIFAAAAPICGGANTTMYGKKQAKVPFYIYHGAVDGVVKVEYSQQLNARLKELGGQVRYIEYPNVNHNSWTNVFAEADYLKILFSHRR
jgi:predicted peptidase